MGCLEYTLWDARCNTNTKIPMGCHIENSWGVSVTYKQCIYSKCLHAWKESLGCLIIEFNQVLLQWL